MTPWEQRNGGLWLDADRDVLIRELTEENRNLKNLLRLRCCAVNCIVHEMRGRLASARGYGKLVLNDHAGPLNGKQQEYLRMADASSLEAKELLTVLSHLGEWPELDLSQFDLLQLFEEVIWNCLPGVTPHFVRTGASGRRGPLFITADRLKLSVALVQLLRSAHECPSQPGEIVLEISETHQDVVVIAKFDALPPAFSQVRAAIFLHGGLLSLRPLETTGVEITLSLPRLAPVHQEEFHVQRTSACSGR